MSSMSEVVSIASYFKDHELAKRVFEAVVRSATISGWALAKDLQIKSDDLKAILDELRAQGLIHTDGPGLDAFFYPSALGLRYGSYAS